MKKNNRHFQMQLQTRYSAAEAASELSLQTLTLTRANDQLQYMPFLFKTPFLRNDKRYNVEDTTNSNAVPYH